MAFTTPKHRSRERVVQALYQYMVSGGETPHFDFVCNECARGVADVSYQYEVPTAFGVLTTSNMEA